MHLIKVRLLSLFILSLLVFPCIVSAAEMSVKIDVKNDESAVYRCYVPGNEFEG
jgi:hypothetical protein